MSFPLRCARLDPSPRHPLANVPMPAMVFISQFTISDDDVSCVHSIVEPTQRSVGSAVLTATGFAGCSSSIGVEDLGFRWSCMGRSRGSERTELAAVG